MSDMTEMQPNEFFEVDDEAAPPEGCFLLLPRVLPDGEKYDAAFESEGQRRVDAPERIQPMRQSECRVAARILTQDLNNEPGEHKRYEATFPLPERVLGNNERVGVRFKAKVHELPVTLFPSPSKTIVGSLTAIYHLPGGFMLEVFEDRVQSIPQRIPREHIGDYLLLEFYEYREAKEDADVS